MWQMLKVAKCDDDAVSHDILHKQMTNLISSPVMIFVSIW